MTRPPADAPEGWVHRGIDPDVVLPPAADTDPGWAAYAALRGAVERLAERPVTADPWSITVDKSELRALLAAHPPSPVEATVVEEYEPTPDNTPEHGLSWRDGLDALDALLDDCAQIGQDFQNHVRVSAVRDVVDAVRRYEDDTDESIRQALWEDAVTDGEPWTEVTE